jgi:hypothetical protein
MHFCRTWALRTPVPALPCGYSRVFGDATQATNCIANEGDGVILRGIPALRFAPARCKELQIRCRGDFVELRNVIICSSFLHRRFIAEL